jgi:hypothetical protein
MAEVTLQVHCFQPPQRMLDEKRTEAARYNVTIPLWLVMNIKDRRVPPR